MFSNFNHLKPEVAFCRDVPSHEKTSRSRGWKIPGYPEGKKFRKNPESRGFRINLGNKNSESRELKSWNLKKIPNPGDLPRISGIFRKYRKNPDGQKTMKTHNSRDILRFSYPDPYSDPRDFRIFGIFHSGFLQDFQISILIPAILGFFDLAQYKKSRSRSQLWFKTL